MAPELNTTAANERNLINTNRAGRGSLRVDLAKSAPAGGSGLSIPV